MAEYNGATLLRRYVHGDRADEPLVQYEGAGLTDKRFLEADHQGSVILIADASGATLTTNRYDEYGQPQATNAGRFGYTGQQWLPELGLNYYKARMYAPQLGRFMQTDPIGYDGGINLYAYVSDDPVNNSDPSGLQGCSDAGKDNQARLGGACFDASALNPKDDGNQTVVGTPEIDQSARTNMPRIANDRGPNENIAQFDQDGSKVKFTPLSTTTGEGAETVQGRATPIGNPDAIGHSQPDLDDGMRRRANLAPGFENKRTGDHVQANAGRPNYIINRRVVIVIEKSQGQFRARVISGTPSRTDIREIKAQLNRLQRGLKMKKLNYIMTFFLLCSCVSALGDPVYDLVRNSSFNDGKRVQVDGIIGVNHGLINLFSKNRNECIGLLASDEQRRRLVQLEGNVVRVSGTLEAEGCGREGICVEHLCGPAILTNISIDQPR